MNNFNPEAFLNAQHTYIYQTFENAENNICKWRYFLPSTVVNDIAVKNEPFGGDVFRESTFLKNYSRKTKFLPFREVRKEALIRASDKNPFLSDIERKERWADTCVRVVEGAMSHYADHMKRHSMGTDLEWMDTYATGMVWSLFHMKWVAPGRGLYVMGTDHTYNIGNAALNNCYAVSTEHGLIKPMTWAMDMLMCGGGVGADVRWKGEVIMPTETFEYSCPDSRQGWVSCLELLLRAYIPIDGKIGKLPIIDFGKVRGYDTPIKGFGGTASGPEPLRVLLDQVKIYLESFLKYQEIDEKYAIDDTSEEVLVKEAEFYRDFFKSLCKAKAWKPDEFPVTDMPKGPCGRKVELSSCKNCDFCRDSLNYSKYLNQRKVIFMSGLTEKKRKRYSFVRLIMDIFNSIGICVVAGNVRRSAQIGLGDPDSGDFFLLKDWALYPERSNIMYMSNNTIRLWKDKDFEEMLPKIAERIISNGEPGCASMINIKKYGRMGDTTYGEDNGELLNPCGETVLASFEPCCLSTVIPYNCQSEGEERDAYDYATFYATVVVTIPHHWSETNKIVAKNRRIGVSMGGISDIYAKRGTTGLIKTFRDGYRHVRASNKKFSSILGIPRAIRVTVVKPEGTMSIITGTSPGVHFPIIRQGKRRICYLNTDPLLKVLTEAGYELEASTKTNRETYVVFPYSANGPKSANEASLTEKFMLALCAQRNWSDNAVSFTGDFNMKTEASIVEPTLVSAIQQTKCLSLFPQFEMIPGMYKHLPFEATSIEVFEEMKSKLKHVDWSDIYNPKPGGKVMEADKGSVMYCTTDACMLKSL